MKGCFGFWTISFLLCACLPAAAQWKELPSTGSPSNQLADRTTLAGQAGVGPLLIAKLIDAKANAQNHKVVVQVETDGVKIVDPALDGEPKIDEAHIQYRLDNSPIQNTTTKTWTFKQVASGVHLIRVALATSDNHQLGEEKSLRVKVP